MSINTRDRFIGCALGAAIGDALGAPVEFDSNPGIVTNRKIHNLHARCRPTDDTQMAEVVLDSLVGELGRTPGKLPEAEPVMDNIANGFIAWSRHPKGGHRAPGNECMAGCRELARRRGAPRVAMVPASEVTAEHGLRAAAYVREWWENAGRDPGPRTGGGCGSVMRAYPFGLLASSAAGLPEAIDWAVQQSSMTHRHPIAHAACAAITAAVAAAVDSEVGVPPTATSGPDRYGSGKTGTPDAVRYICGEAHEAAVLFDDSTAKLIDEATTAAVLWRHNEQGGRTPTEVLTEWQGWDARTAIAAGIYCFVVGWDDPAEALLMAANTPGDSDSIATITGALIGALHGAEALPAAWRRDVEWGESIARTADALYVLTSVLTSDL